MKNLLQPIIIVLSIFVALALYSRFGPSIPFSMLFTQNGNLFTVSGEGKVTIIPDSAKINVGLTIDAQNIKTAHLAANQKINKLNDDLTKLGVKGENIKTTSYYITPDYDYSGTSTRAKGFTVSINQEVIVENLDLINQVIDTAVADGGNLVGGLSFDVNEKKRRELEDEARKIAITDAKNKAKSMASAAGVALGRVTNVAEAESFYPHPVPLIGLQTESTDQKTQVEPGTSEIVSHVTLTFETR